MPQAQTVQIPKRLPMVAAPENRDETTAKDARIINSYIERAPDGQQYWWYRRPGLLTNLTQSGDGYGSYNWKGDIYEVFGTTLYKNGTSLGTVDGTAGVYQFTSCLGSTPRLVLGNGVKGYTYDGTTLAQITDSNFPTTFVKGWAFLDGTVYVMDSGAHIYGSDLNDPTTWNALNVLIAQIEPDAGVALTKQLVYVVALKQWTTEIFYDAGNATGSPLGTVQGAKVNWGCLSADGVQSIDDIIFWPATNRASAAAVFKLENLKATRVSTKPIERLLDNADYSNVRSWAFKHNGHRLYGLTLVNTNLTLVYDLDEDRWAQWTDVNGNYWPIASMTYTNALAHYAQHMTNGKRYAVESTVYTDDGAIFSAEIYTPLMDFGIDRKKYVNFLHLEGDKVPGSTIQVRVSDDDYQTWTNWRSFNMNQRRPTLTNLGTFYRRAWHFRHQSNTWMRARAGDWQVDLGTL